MSAVTWNGDGARTMKSAISRATDASGSISNPLFEKPSVYKAHVNRHEAVEGRRHRFAQRSAIPPGNSVLVSRFPDEFVEHLSHQSRISAHDGGGCRDVAVGVEVLPVEDEAGV